MNYLEIFRTSISALRANIMRTSLTMLGIVIGIASVILIISLAQGATAAITNQISSFGTNLIFIAAGGDQDQAGPPTSTDTLTYDDALSIAKLPLAEAVSPVVAAQYQISADGLNTTASVQGVSGEFSTVQTINMQYGDFISVDDENSLGRVAVLGWQIALDLFGENFDPTGESILIDSKPFRVIGVAAKQGGGLAGNLDETIYVPVTTAQTILLGQDFVQSIIAKADSPENVPLLQEEITQLLLDRHNIEDEELADFTILTSAQFLSTFGQITGVLTAMLAGIGAISLLVGGIGIMNIMLVTVTERTKEIGLLKSIGAKRKDILTQFLIESVVLTVFGGLIGIILGVSFAWLISTFLLKVPFVLQLSSILLAVGISSFVGIIFGIYPAQRAAKLSPIEALRYE